ncbi:MAG: DNA pilot protein [Microvirus sp.]|nr:MAG: DNA pilot protein [Microvirus sp.]
MFGVDDALLGAGLGAAANFVGGLFQNSAADKQSKDQMAFQERMSNTQYQRGMADMKAAGLNPMLAYAQGGASSPSGSSAPVVNVGEAAMRGVQDGVNSAKTGMMVKSQIENLNEDTKLKMAQSAASVEQAKLANANSAVVLGTMPYVIDKANYDSGTAGLVFDQNLPRSKRGINEARYLDTDVGKALATAAIAGSDASQASSALKNLPLVGSWMK